MLDRCAAFWRLDRHDARLAGARSPLTQARATHVHPRTRSFRRCQVVERLSRVGGSSRVTARRRLSERGRLLQPGKRVLPRGEYGRAIAAYRKAKPYRPRDPYLEANLRQALSVAPGRLSEPPAPWWKHVLFWSDWLSFPEKVYLAFAGFVLAALVSCAALFCAGRVPTGSASRS